MLLVCCTCKESKDEESFYRFAKNKRTGRQAQCKECNKKAVRDRLTGDVLEKRLAENKARRNQLVDRMREYKRERGCACCGETEPVCLDFHHPNDDKEGTPAVLINRSWQAFLTEALKCVVLCSNCHRKVHAGIIVLPELVD